MLTRHDLKVRQTTLRLICNASRLVTFTRVSLVFVALIGRQRSLRLFFEREIVLESNLNFHLLVVDPLVVLFVVLPHRGEG